MDVAIRQAVKMSPVKRGIPLADIAEVVNEWEPPRQRTIEDRAPRRPVLEAIDGGTPSCPWRRWAFDAYAARERNQGAGGHLCQTLANGMTHRTMVATEKARVLVVHHFFAIIHCFLKNCKWFRKNFVVKLGDKTIFGVPLALSIA
ncbi:hypothetical protein [Rhizobium johnstonii]|uniref:hypothetical protein n=1 Tax=Rhizobium johnstonii TaxID=3019933 RepID=UPI003F9B3930